MVFPLSLSDSKSSQVSRTLLSILADLNDAEVWIVPTRNFQVLHCSVSWGSRIHRLLLCREVRPFYKDMNAKRKSFLQKYEREVKEPLQRHEREVKEPSPKVWTRSERAFSKGMSARWTSLQQRHERKVKEFSSKAWTQSERAFSIGIDTEGKSFVQNFEVCWPVSLTKIMTWWVILIF